LKKNGWDPLEENMNKFSKGCKHLKVWGKEEEKERKKKKRREEEKKKKQKVPSTCIVTISFNLVVHMTMSSTVISSEAPWNYMFSPVESRGEIEIGRDRERDRERSEGDSERKIERGR
jgi:hypothetical protein